MVCLNDSFSLLLCLMISFMILSLICLCFLSIEFSINLVFSLFLESWGIKTKLIKKNNQQNIKNKNQQKHKHVYILK